MTGLDTWQIGAAYFPILTNRESQVAELVSRLGLRTKRLHRILKRDRRHNQTARACNISKAWAFEIAAS